MQTSVVSATGFWGDALFRHVASSNSLQGVFCVTCSALYAGNSDAKAEAAERKFKMDAASTDVTKCPIPSRESGRSHSAVKKFPLPLPSRRAQYQSGREDAVPPRLRSSRFRMRRASPAPAMVTRRLWWQTKRPSMPPARNSRRPLRRSRALSVGPRLGRAKRARQGRHKASDVQTLSITIVMLMAVPSRVCICVHVVLGRGGRHLQFVQKSDRGLVERRAP